MPRIAKLSRDEVDRLLTEFHEKAHRLPTAARDEIRRVLGRLEGAVESVVKPKKPKVVAVKDVVTKGVLLAPTNPTEAELPNKRV